MYRFFPEYLNPSRIYPLIYLHVVYYHEVTQYTLNSKHSSSIRISTGHIKMVEVLDNR